MAETKFVVIPDPRINPTSLLVVSPIKNRLRSSLLVLFNLGSGITSLRACLVVALMLLCSSNSFANPWLPKPGKWKYNLQYSKYTIPESIKFYEHDLYIRLDQKQALLSQELAQFNNNITTEIINQKAALLASNAQALEALPPQAQQDALTQIYAQNPDIQILYKRRNNIVTDIKN